MTTFDPETVRADAIEALGPMGDARARDLLSQGTIEIAASDLTWSGSAGEMRTHRVLLGVDGRSLGVVRSHPSVEDALCGAMSAAIGRVEGQALRELVIFWGLEERDEAPDYRSSGRRLVPIDRRTGAPSSEAFVLALRGYLDAIDFPHAASCLGNARVTVRRSTFGLEVTLFVHPDDASEFRQDEDLAVERALADLASGARNEAVSVVRRAA